MSSIQSRSVAATGMMWQAAGTAPVNLSQRMAATSPPVGESPFVKPAVPPNPFVKPIDDPSDSGLPDECLEVAAELAEYVVAHPDATVKELDSEMRRLWKTLDSPTKPEYLSSAMMTGIAAQTKQYLVTCDYDCTKQQLQVMDDLTINCMAVGLFENVFQEKIADPTGENETW